MYSSCKNQGTAWDVLKFATSQAQDGKLLDETGQMPMRRTCRPRTRRTSPRTRSTSSSPSRPTAPSRCPTCPTRSRSGRRSATPTPSRSSSARADLDSTLRHGRRQDRQARRRPVTRGHVHHAPATPRPGARLPAGPGTAAAGPLRARLVGRQPLGIAFVSPYVVFLAAVFVYPLGFAVWMSFHDYFFAAPGVNVDRPSWGSPTTRGPHRPRRAPVLPQRRHLPGHQRPADGAASLVLATALNAGSAFRTFFRAAYYVPYVTASVAVVGVWLFLFNSRRPGQQGLGPLAPDPSWLVNSHLAMPRSRSSSTWKQLGFFILLYLAALQNVPEGALRVGVARRRRPVRSFLLVTVPAVRPATLLVWSWPPSPARTCSPSPTCSPAAAGRTGRPPRRCC